MTLHLGIDAGSISLDAVILDDSGATVVSTITPIRGRTIEGLARALESLHSSLPDAVITSSCATGSGSNLLASLLSGTTVNEITAHAIGTGPLLPDSTPCSLLEIGGQDSKFLQLQRSSDHVEVSDYAMNTLCAAGTGTFFDGQAERLGICVEELARLAAEAPRAARVAGRCVVFAKTDIIHHQQRGTALEELALGLCHSAARNIVGTLIQGRTVHRPLFFTGGVAANSGMVRALHEVLGLPEHLPLVPEDHRILGAEGAALRARDSSNPIPLSELASRANAALQEVPAAPTHPTPPTSWTPDLSTENITAGLPDTPGPAAGLDIGSVSVKWALIDSGRITDSWYAFTEGRPVQALSQALDRLKQSPARSGRPLTALGVTGSGRKLAARLLHANVAVNEITAHATAMRVLDPDVDTIFEIGGQDAKYVRLSRDRIEDFAMNTACSAGTGSLLLEEAARLGLSVEELDDHADRSASPTELHDRCTVFIDSDLVSRMQQGTPTEDLAAGMLRAVARNYLDRVVAHRVPGEHIVFAGGVSRSRTVRREFERILDRPVQSSPWGMLSGAIGAALIALRDPSLHDLDKLSIPLTPRSTRAIRCSGCGGSCSITRLDFQDLTRCYTGDACGRWSDRTDDGPDPSSPRDRPSDDLFEIRSRLYGMDTQSPPLTRGQIGIPRAQQYWDLYPLLLTLLTNLGLDTGLSSPTTRSSIQHGIALSRTEQCMPVKVALAHCEELLSRGATSLFLPCIGEYPQLTHFRHPEAERLLPCIYTMQVGPVVRATLKPDVPVLVPGLSLNPELDDQTVRNLTSALKPLGRFSRRRVRAAFHAARESYLALRETSESMGLRSLRSATPENPAVVIFGRPYTIYDPVLNIQLVERLRRLGLTPIPFDTILSAGSVQDHHSFMQWKMGSDHLRAARAMVPFPSAYPLLLTYYGCGPDAFIQKYFPEILGDRPTLSLELDGHSAEAGLETRLEAFADAMRSDRTPKIRKPTPAPTLARNPGLLRGRVVSLPYFSDTVYAFAGAIDRAGMEARIMPLATDESRLLGERYSDGRECNPHTILLGDLVKWAQDDSLPNTRKGFFVPSARGPCLLTHYAQSYARVLRKLDAQDILVWNPHGPELQQVMDLDQLTGLWQGIVATNYIFRWWTMIHPYETDPGLADQAKSAALSLIRDGIRQGDAISSIRKAVPLMQQVPHDRPNSRDSRIRVGVIGDLYTRVNPFANQNLYATLESLGCEIIAPSFMMEGQLYDLWDNPREYLEHGHYAKATRRMLLSIYQLEETWRIKRLFPPHPEISYDAGGLSWRRSCSRYFNSDVDGYLAQNLGKGMDAIDMGAEGILNVICHNCMVGLTTEAIVPEVRADHQDIPFFTIAYDSLGDVHVRTRLEAFVDLLRARR